MTDGENGASRAPAAPPKDTVVEEGTTLSGTLDARGRVLVMGRLEGVVKSPAVEVTETGALSGRIKAGTLRSRGALGGTLDADEIDLGGRILDQTLIRARDLAVALGDADTAGAQFGDCELQVGDEPDREQAVNDAANPARTGLFDPRAPR